MTLDRAAILAARTLKKELVPAPEWGGDVFVRVMNGLERDMLDDLLVKHNNQLPNLRATLVCLTTCDEDGGRLFDLKDVDAVSEMDGNVLHRLFLVARRLNGLDPEAAETITKNSMPAPSDAPGSN